MEHVPVLDLDGDYATAVTTLDAALRRYGFFYLANYGSIPNGAALVEAQFKAAEQFFDLPFVASTCPIG